MSLETMNWLNTKTLIGFTEKRGNAWHYKRELQEGRGNHYVGPVPVESVNGLFFDALEGTTESVAITSDGVVKVISPNRKCILRPPGTFGPDDVGGILNETLLKGQPGQPEGWKLHQYREWLVATLGDILDTSVSDLGIASAGLLQQGGMAWVQIEAPENIETPVGFTFRPFILAATAHTGNMSTTFKRACTAVVCDNTLSAGLGERGMVSRTRHTRNSEAKLGGIRDALQIIHTTGDDFARQVEELADIVVSDGDFERFLDELAPFVDSKGKELAPDKRGRVQAKRDKVAGLYLRDPRCTPWYGSALGVLQAVNTFEHHIKGTTNLSGPQVAQRNMLRTVQGKTDAADADTVKMIREVVAN